MPLVAHHSRAIIEAEERGLADILSREFEPAPYVLSSVLTCCHMTTSPDGELLQSKPGSPRSTTASPGTWLEPSNPQPPMQSPPSMRKPSCYQVKTI
jgi:hypothetical protein